MQYRDIRNRYIVHLVDALIEQLPPGLCEKPQRYMRELAGDSMAREAILPFSEFLETMEHGGHITEAEATHFDALSNLDLDMNIHLENALGAREAEILAAINDAIFSVDEDGGERTWGQEHARRGHEEAKNDRRKDGAA